MRVCIHTETSELDLVDVRAVSVGRFAHVDARVLGIRVENVERDETKVVHRPEAMTYNTSIVAVYVSVTTENNLN